MRPQLQREFSEVFNEQRWTASTFSETSNVTSGQIREWLKGNATPILSLQHLVSVILREEVTFSKVKRTHPKVNLKLNLPLTKENRRLHGIKLGKLARNRAMSAETRAKISNTLTGIKVSKATRAKMAKSAKTAWAIRKATQAKAA